MQLKTRKYLTFFIILLLASLFLIATISSPNKIVGNAITEINKLVCEYAEEGGTCFTKLTQLGIITPEECCQEIGKCCAELLPIEEEPTTNYEINYINDSTILKGFELPEGYSIIYEPFNVQCTSPTDLILNIPINYQDAKILKCVGEQCYLKIIEKTITTQLGDIIINVTKETEELKPTLIELEAEEIKLNINSFQDLIQLGGTEFYGEFFDNLKKILYPTENIEEKEQLDIIDGPFTLYMNEIQDPLELPFTINKNIQGEIVGLFARKDDKWIPVTSKIDRENNIILADIKNIQQFAVGDTITLAIMGVTIRPVNVIFRRAYNPPKPSRDAVILVHGLATTKIAFKYLIEDIKQTKQPFQLWTFNYPSTKYIDEIADDLSDAIEKNINSYDRIFIVAHSMGGIIAQQALYNAYRKQYSYTDKVKKAILIATPNEGSVVAEAYEYLFSTLVHKSIGIHEIFHINEKFVSDLIKGRIIPKVPGVDYYVIAGTGRYTEGLIGLVSQRVDPAIKFDGVVSTKSAQNIGGQYVNDTCKNYWEINMTHMELVDDYVSRQIIGKIISEEISKTKEEITGLGNNKYYKLKVEECSPDIYYLAIGRMIGPKPVEDSSGCSCGDGFCGVGENIFKCPADCAKFFTAKYFKTKSVVISILIIILILLIGLFVWKKPFKPKSKKSVKRRI